MGGGIVRRLGGRIGSESGFTLIELLVVMLILGILAAIAIPAFMSQKSKASDASAKAEARAMATAIETCRTENTSGTYGGCNLPRIRGIEPTISADADVPLFDAQAYVVESAPADTTNNVYRILKVDGATNRDCTLGSAGDAGGCNIGGQDAAEGVDGTW